MSEPDPTLARHHIGPPIDDDSRRMIGLFLCRNYTGDLP